MTSDKIQDTGYRIKNNQASCIMNRVSCIGSSRASCILHLANERGVALVMILVLSAIALAIMAGLIYILVTGTQVSGMQKRYKTALEAGEGGADITYQLIGLRGGASSTTSLLSALSGISPSITTSASCTGTNRDGIAFSGFAAKLNTPSTSWSWACNTDSVAINPSSCTSSLCTYDFRADLGSSPYPTYRVYTKIVDTVEGNTGGDEGLLGKGVVVSGTGEVTVMTIPYLYTIETDTQNVANPNERAKLSILYQY